MSEAPSGSVLVRRGPAPRLVALHAELRRRHVYRTATAYGVLAAGTVQLTDVVAPALGLPASTVATTLYFLLAGFPLVLGLSWLFDVRRERRGGLLSAEETAAEAAALAPAPVAAALPRPASALVGREAELRQAGRLLADPACRLLTFTGPGGI